MFRIKVSSSRTMYGFYNSKEEAVEAKDRISKEGDSIGMKYSKSEMKIVECQEDNSDKGWSDI